MSSSNGELRISETQKAANDAYFERLGSSNSTRSAELAPSQGGRYQGFGNSPSPPAGSQHPSYGLSSAAVPSLSELQENPTAALSKGWSLFSAALSGVTRAVTENVIQPGLEKVTDPNLHASVRGYYEEASKRVGAVGLAASQTVKTQTGVDVAGQVGGWMDNFKGHIGSGPSSSGYGAVEGQAPGDDDWSRFHDEDDFFGEFKDQENHVVKPTTYADQGLGASRSTKPSAPAPTPAKKADDWDEWNDF